jgi:hypothetical protein
MRTIVPLVAAIALISGCSPAPSAAPHASSPSASVPPASISAGSATQHIVAGPLGLEIPAGWHQRAGSLNPSGNVTLMFVGPVDLPSDCQVTAQGGTCFSWPMLQLAPGGVVVAVRLYGLPGFQQSYHRLA